MGGGLPDPSLRGLLPPLARRQETAFSQPCLDKVCGCEEGLSYGAEPLRSSRATPARAASNGAEGTPPPTDPTILQLYISTRLIFAATKGLVALPSVKIRG